MTNGSVGYECSRYYKNNYGDMSKQLITYYIHMHNL